MPSSTRKVVPITRRRIDRRWNEHIGKPIASIDELTFTSRDAAGRICWWDIATPKTPYSFVHRALGTAYAYEFLELVNNPEAEIPDELLAFITSEGTRTSPTFERGSMVLDGFVAAISTYFVTGRLDR